MDCGDGVTGDDPDRDFCIYESSTGGNCAKDCRVDVDCPQGFRCHFFEVADMCIPVASSCLAMDEMGTSCTTSCTYTDCHGGICTTTCTVDHDCPEGMHCSTGWCVDT
jgi:hypothetical protein